MNNKFLFSEKMYHWPVRFLLVAKGEGLLRNIDHVCACLLISIDQPFTLSIGTHRITTHCALIPQGCVPSVILAEGRHCLWGLDGLQIHQETLRKSYVHQSMAGICYDFEPQESFIEHAQHCADTNNIEAIDMLYRQLINPYNRVERMVNWDARIVSYLYHSVTCDIPAKETLAYAANRARMSESNFRQLFKKSFGISFSHYCIYRKLKQFCKLYAETKNLSQSATGSGFTDLPHAINAYRNALGTSPGSIFLSKNFQMIFSTTMDCKIIPIRALKNTSAN